VSQVASSAGSVLLAVAFPSDAASVFGPQAVGVGVVAIGAMLVLVAQPGSVATAALGPASAAWLRVPLRTVAVGLTIWAGGWLFYGVAERNEPWQVLAAALLGALNTCSQAGAVWWIVARLPLRPTVATLPVSLEDGSPTIPDVDSEGLARAARWIFRAISWLVALLLLLLAIGFFIVGDTGARIIGVVLVIAFVLMTRTLIANRPKRPKTSWFDRA
jgi:hypothetical protein